MAAGIAEKLDAALSLLRGGMVFNVLAREGRRIEVETVNRGETRNMTVGDFSEQVVIESVELSMSEGEELGIQRIDAVQTLDQKVTREDMVVHDKRVDQKAASRCAYNRAYFARKLKA